MDIFDAIQANLLSPAVLFFALGLIAAITKSDLKFPEPLYVALTIYLLIAIGFKGGVAIAEAGLGKVWLPALAAMLLGAIIPLWTYPVLRFGGKFSAVDAAAIAAHYGSVSAVTFIAATNYLKAMNQPFESYATAFLAVMESPAILVGVLLGKLATSEPGKAEFTSLKSALHEALFGRSIRVCVGERPERSRFFSSAAFSSTACGPTSSRISRAAAWFGSCRRRCPPSRMTRRSS